MPKTAMPAAGIDQQIGPNSFPWKCLAAGCKTNTSKVEQIGLQSFASSAIFTWFLANQLANHHFFKHLHEFLQGKCFHKQQEAENAFQEFVKSLSMDFYTTGIKSWLSMAKTC